MHSVDFRKTKSSLYNCLSAEVKKALEMRKIQEKTQLVIHLAKSKKMPVLLEISAKYGMFACDLYFPK